MKISDELVNRITLSIPKLFYYYNQQILKTRFHFYWLEILRYHSSLIQLKFQNLFKNVNKWVSEYFMTQLSWSNSMLLWNSNAMPLSKMRLLSNVLPCNNTHKLPIQVYVTIKFKWCWDLFSVTLSQMNIILLISFYLWFTNSALIQHFVLKV